MALALFCRIPAWQNMILTGIERKNERLWDQLQSTVWDKSASPCENCSHWKLWIGSSLHCFKLWLMEQNKRPFLGTNAEAHQTKPNWTMTGLALRYNRARNYQGLFQLAWCGLVLQYVIILHAVLSSWGGMWHNHRGTNVRTSSRTQLLSAKFLWFNHYVYIVSLWNITFYYAVIKQPFYVPPKMKS